jgi:hypothetical protein
VIDLALHYVRQGWPVFPLAPGGKEPVVKGGHGCLDATLDLNRVEAWWREYPAANVGVATGRRSGLLVVDVDPRKTTDWLASLNSMNLPPTFTVRTWSRGYHLYFRLPGKSAISIGADLLPGIDWRGNGGYVVGAGSVVNGVTYEIVRNVEMVSAPASLIEQISKHGKGARVAARSGSGRMLIPESKRNEQLFRIGCALRRFGVEPTAIYESLRAVNAEHCSPPIDDDELHKIGASAGRYAPDAGASRAMR